LLKHEIECPKVYGDPALLLPSLVRNDIKKSYRVGIVPHFSHKEYFQSIIKKDARVCMIDVEWPVCNVVKKILACEVILATSLHGLIVAEAYGIPSLMLTVGKPLHGSLFKIEDYFHSTRRALSIYDVQSVTNLASLTELAERQPDVFFDTAPLLAAFPCARADLSNTPAWSEFKPKEDFRNSLLPPRLKVPSP
jgi:pyruvyltransferase